MDMIEASTLLWRLPTGQDVGERWQELAAAWGGAHRRQALPL
ncbi:hypothetical protein R6258_10125 [Halomonas sp. HP20-15]|nr:hypothetical protein [Halomonas sp. HP20-15]MDW5377272.1 hypothetical protein [Halomonas sp. HP20-15]